MTDEPTSESAEGPAEDPSDDPPEDPDPPPLGKWERPRPPLDWRSVMGGAGRVLIAAGLLTFGFVAYQLYGTGIETARAQSRLEDEFAELLAQSTTTMNATPPATTAPATTPTTDRVAETTAPTTTAGPATTVPATTTSTVAPSATLPPISEGDAVARLEIPDIDVDAIVVAGVAVDDLERGPGHYPETPLPGQLGNAAIAGHRTTFGQVFADVDDLVPGDEIIVTTPAGRFVYAVTGTQIVDPSDWWVIDTVDPDVATLTLTSCHPRWSARQRIIVGATLRPEDSDPVGEATPYARPIDRANGENGEPPASTGTAAIDTAEPEQSDDRDRPDATVVAADQDDSRAAADDASPGGVPSSAEEAFERGWFHDRGAFGQVALWGLVLTAIAIGSWLLSRRARRDLVGFSVGVLPFLLALYFFFQNVNRLLPPGL